MSGLDARACARVPPRIDVLASALIGVALAMASNGLQSSTLGLRGRIEGFSPTQIGTTVAASYAGLLIGSLFMPALVARFGHRRINWITALCFSVLMPGFVLIHDWRAWVVLRMLCGTMLSGLYVTFESWFNVASEENSRVQFIASYMVAVYVGLICGQVILLAAGEGKNAGLLIAALLMLFAPIAARLRSFPHILKPLAARLSFRRMLAAMPDAVLGCLVFGISQGTFFGLGATALRADGMTMSEISLVMTAGIGGALIGQFAIGFAAVRIRRRHLLTAMTVIGAVAIAAAGAVRHGNQIQFTLMFCAWGAASMPVYSLIIAQASERLSREQLVSLSAHFLRLYGVGAIIGPAIAGWLMDCSTPAAFYGVLGTANIVIAAASARRG